VSITKESAWVIFRADKLGHEEAAGALDAMTEDEWNAYQSYSEEFDFEIAKVGVEAQNEAAAIIENHAELKYLEAIKPHNWIAMDYRNLVTPFAGSKFEKLHLSAMFRVNNAELLLELVKP